MLVSHDLDIGRFWMHWLCGKPAKVLGTELLHQRHEVQVICRPPKSMTLICNAHSKAHELHNRVLGLGVKVCLADQAADLQP